MPEQVIAFSEDEESLLRTAAEREGMTIERYVRFLVTSHLTTQALIPVISQRARDEENKK